MYLRVSLVLEAGRMPFSRKRGDLIDRVLPVHLTQNKVVNLTYFAARWNNI